MSSTRRGNDANEIAVGAVGVRSLRYKVAHARARRSPDAIAATVAATLSLGLIFTNAPLGSFNMPAPAAPPAVLSAAVSSA